MDNLDGEVGRRAGGAQAPAGLPAANAWPRRARTERPRAGQTQAIGDVRRKTAGGLPHAQHLRPGQRSDAIYFGDYCTLLCPVLLKFRGRAHYHPSSLRAAFTGRKHGGVTSEAAADRPCVY